MQGIFKNSLIFLGCEILSKSIPFLMLPYLTRVLNTEGFGQLGLFTSLQALVLIMINFSFEGAIARYYYRYGNRNYHSVFCISLLFIPMLSAIALFIGKAFPIPFNIWKLAVFSGMLQAMFNVFLISQQCRKKVYTYAIYQILFAFLSCGLTIIFFNILGFDFTVRIDAMMISLGGVLFLALITGGLTKINFKLLKNIKINFLYLCSFGFPLIIHQASLYTKGQLDRILIAEKYTYTDLAVYTAAFQIASVISVVILAINKATVPFFFEACKNKTLDHIKIRKIFLFSLPLSLLPAAFSWILPDSVYVMILGNKYLPSVPLIHLFVLGFGLTLPYLIVVNYLFYHNKNSLVSVISFSSSAFHLFMLLILRNYGLVFIPFALISSSILCIIMLYVIGIKKHEG